jgi:CDP-diacylglycerol pyrophosphatase
MRHEPRHHADAQVDAICDDAGDNIHWNDMSATLCRFITAFFAGTVFMVFAPAATAQKSHIGKSATESPIDPQKPTGRSALRQTVQSLCVLNWQQHRNPAPCERVVLTDLTTNSSGYAVIADPSGGAHYLLVPTQTMPGLDGAEFLDPDLPNFFADAWRARDLITAFAGHEVPRTDVGLVMGVGHSRVQDQFHIHIDCLRQEAVDVLRTSVDGTNSAWSPVAVAGATYQAMPILAKDLEGSNVFEMLATLPPDARHHMGDYTLIVAGMQFKSGPGFVVLAGTGPSGEILLDSSCAVAGAGG